MASLQDQLLKAGLADKSKAKQARADKRKKQKLKSKGNAVAQDENKLAAQQAAEAKKQRDRELNQQRQAELEKKAVVAQIRQLITVNQQPKGNGDTVLNFTDNNVVKRMYVSDAVHKLVIDARLAVVKLDDDYALIPMPVADKIAERDASVVIYRADLRAENKQKSEEDDWYADYEIPDDLTW
ncbi:DUF2058 domain-containing protein [Alteromonas lipolytica]|uniref:Nucleoprotein/polynucleotide-associated enzyme n=1 Tax=Alteromonas lipolytica TaxID=1856405 RepID=A0A1E8FIM6_9ALTE|nr:DUF2058 domain-containing protein [Alteromonas lipolytica]OFI35792.1 nucleoprotein/polynucleotide-associated enzyme [Alteromonas lipolytica]GGF80851.1 hypothetical protein GCM10011338_36370 [Alteromonas lipolytica]